MSELDVAETLWNTERMNHSDRDFCLHCFSAKHMRDRDRVPFVWDACC